MTKTTRPKLGDIFRIPVGQRGVVHGQIVAKTTGIPPLIAVYDRLSEPKDGIDLGEIVAGRIAFLVTCFDVKIARGDWPVVGSVKPDLARVPLPSFKFGLGDEVYVISFDGTRRRRATPDEIPRLQYQNAISPAVMERVVRAYHGLEDWVADFERYTYESAVLAAAIVP